MTKFEEEVCLQCLLYDYKILSCEAHRLKQAWNEFKNEVLPKVPIIKKMHIPQRTSCINFKSEVTK